ncbi:type IV secretion protein Rhs [Chryseobacterium fluminis]|uniref:RHS repeat-associated core domain-containing protein n=1 Tax=Chryseobacterium fluminis TaxID=2983606 RepID=UPI002251A9B2|nr:RHS repeat-associated core domain-containing protein [Chryseobacterium sp. MMS21-Ot14]UZT97986.1 type IV secretion protein Rhs [Chryseobacterium sp. MMS21-Ot14]
MRLFSSFILSLCAVMGFSQTILYQAENSSRTVQDPQAVVLAQGFKASGSVSNPFVGKIGPATENPGGGPTDSNAGVNNPSGTNAPSGQSFYDTKGSLGVTGSGQLQYTLSVALPPGVKSVAPQIDLAYTSGSGNGIAGYGWNLSGITAITRMGKSVEVDGEAKGLQLDYSDYYSFNGQRLILKSGEYGKDAEYITARYSNMKIKSIGTAQGSTSQPMYFQVTFEDGSQAWYGDIQSDNPQLNTFNGRTSLEYNLVKWKDAQGNYISYSYEYTTGQMQESVSRISSVQWGGNEALNKPHFNRIDFNYTDRNLVEESYVAGYKFVQNKLLTDITVKSNGNPYRKYIIDYVQNGTNYKFVNKITEYNSQGEAANPVVFTYPNLVPASVDYYGVLPYNSDSFENVRLTGDFNGDSYLDFVMSNGVVKLGAFNDAYQDVSTGKVFNAEAKIVNVLLDEDGQVYNGNGIVQYESGKVVGYIFRNNGFVKVFEKALSQTPCTSCNVSLNEGDINGDGISDVFITLSPQSGFGIVDKYIVDLKNSSIPVSTYSVLRGFNESDYPNQRYLDVDGDGKIDIIDVSNTAYTVFEFVKTSPTQYVKKIKYSGNLAETKDSDYPVLFGDFNGDGNLDFTIPVTANQGADNWRFYMGMENGFQNVLKQNFLKYRKPTQPSNLSLIDHHFYSISDINKDGKSDIVFIHSKNKVGAVNNSGNALWRSLQYDVNTLQANGGTDFIPGLSSASPSYSVGGGEYGLFQPMTNPIKSNNNYYDIFVFKNTRVHKYKAQTSLAELSRVKSITQAGITTIIDYKELNPDINPSFYAKVKKEYYPYFSLIRADNSYAVSQLLQGNRKQDFRYRGMTTHMQGRGVIGYHQTARSSWYAEGYENTKIWSGIEINPFLDAAPEKEWSIKTNDESKIFPADISVNNTQLLSFKSTVHQKDQLINGSLVTTVTDADKPKVVTVIIPKSTVEKNFLTGTVTTGTITYGDYYLPIQSTSNVNNGYGTANSTFEYVHNPSGTGADYYIGRPKSKTDIVQAYGDTKSAKKEYTYENNLLKTLKNWNRINSEYLQETYFYDDFGNVIQEVTSNNVDSQIHTAFSEYDTKGRFVLKSIDNLGLETNIEYNDFGQIKKTTDPSGNSKINTYDIWGKLISVKSNLSGTTKYQYEKDNSSNIISTQYHPDGNITKIYTNRLGQEFKVSTKSFGQGQFVSKEIQYDLLGRKINESESYFEGQAATQWNTINYDDSIYPAKVTATSSSGKQIETIVSGLTTTVKELNGYNRITSKTSDALGNMISSADKGGTILFSYNAAGEQIRAQYAENIVTTKYDAWGRKSELNDPSNGLYKYEYDIFGQPKKIISPKGTKEYIYNNLGKLITQKEISTSDAGLATNKIISYTYDNKGRIISKGGTSKGKAYSSNISYDSQGRLLSASESSNGKFFIQKGITYDDKGRVISYEKQLFSSGMLTKIQIENIYDAWNGELYQVKDKVTGRILWELQETNAKGKIVRSKLGSANVTNTYDNNGFLTNVNHSSAVKPGILQLSYSFDAIKNELKSRTTGGDFNIVESFDYDDNNRLVNWTNPVTGVKPSLNRNVYDIKGRIIENDQVGTMKYENSAKIYQPTGMTLNATGTQNYNNDLIQNITYNENNDPVFIDGMKGDVAFQYGLTAMRQRVTYGGNFTDDTDGKFTKYYNEDGSFEVQVNNTTGKEKHILYIGGSPYESNIVFLRNFDEANGSYKFLHKDYIGSILAISDESGNKLEQRHFDAWGNFTHLQIGNGAIITDKNTIDNTALLLDRGYTSHEHFTEVGIIHMNGRLYDPLLRRFLNADENIQEPFNTQNYNKYGYVLNNPLIFSDPTGEFFFLAPVIAWVVVNAAAIGTGALIGAALSVAMYTIQATINNNWTLGGFAKAIVTGAVTGAVSAGAGQIFSAGTFIATVGNGAVSGAASGGVMALINGDNFLKGLVKGAVIGGAVAAVSYTVNFLCSAKTEKIKESDLDLSDSQSSTEIANTTTSTDPDVLNDRIKTFRKNNYSDEQIKRYGVAADKLDESSINNTGQYMDGGFIAETRLNFNFIKNTSDITYSARAANNSYLLGKTMAHETAHAYVNKITRLIPGSGNRIGSGLKEGRLDTVEHIAIKKLENTYYNLNLPGMDMGKLNIIPLKEIDKVIKGLSPTMQAQVQSWTEKLFEVFNRKVTYQGLTW